MSLRVIDVSSWQAGLSPVDVDCDAIIIKATGGTDYVNPYWRQWADETLACGKLLGFYHYAMEYGEYASPWDEARHFLDTVADYRGKALVALDFEADAQGLPVSWPRQWLDIVTREWGAKPLFYGYASYLNSRDHSDVAMYPLWMASYLDRYAGGGWVDDPDNIWPISDWDYMTAYQYTSQGSIGGYGGLLDLSIFFGDAEDWHILSGGNGKKEEYMARIEAMVQHALDIAADDSHGYSQDMHQRWDPDRDCSTLMYDAANAAGYDVNGIGPDKTKYTGTMIEDFTHAGFAVHGYGEVEPTRGCIFIRDPYGEGGHTEMYLGDGQTVGAHCSETGGAYGEPGDQTGNEISVAPDPGGWDYVLVPPADEVPKAWPLITWGSNGGDHQRFAIEDAGDGLVSIRCKADGRYLDVSGARDEDGADVCLYSEYHGGKNQLWRIVPSDEGDGCSFIASAMDGGRVLDIVGSNPQPGGSLCIWPRQSANSANQKWLLLDNYDGTKTVLNNGFMAKLVLDSKGGGK